MKIIQNTFLLIIFMFSGMHAETVIAEKKWVVVGAGPAGMVSIGGLLDHGVSPESIAWVDPEFKGGRFMLFKYVLGNTKVARLLNAFGSFKSFDHGECPCLDNLKQANKDKCCPLRFVHVPLMCVTRHLRTKVDSYCDKVTYLEKQDTGWLVYMQDRVIKSQNVILASGAHPRIMNYPSPPAPPLIDLEVSFNPELLKDLVTKDDVVAVFGGADSAMLAVKNLSEIGVKTIINFYRTPIRFNHSVKKQLDRFTRTKGFQTRQLEYADEGLGGGIAEWAAEHVLMHPLKNLIRFKSTDAIVNEYLPQCTKVIYGVGYDPDEIASNIQNVYSAFDYKTGCLAPGLFGIGIAFPGKGLAASGNLVAQIGLPSFSKYALRLIPEWLKQTPSKRICKIKTGSSC